MASCALTVSVITSGRGPSSRIDPARTNGGNPGIRGSFTLTHSDFRGFLGNGLIRKKPNPGFSGSFNLSGHGNTSRFNLPGIYIPAFHRLQAEITEIELSAAGGLSFESSAHPLAILDFFGTQHIYIS